MTKNSEKLVFRVVLGISIVVFLLVVLLNKNVLPVPDSFPSFVYKLPLMNAIINGTCFVLLLISYYMIRHKKISIHKKINLTTFGLSSVFLISYVLYHWLVPETSFGGEGTIRTIYFIILVSHIVLAAIVLPLVLLSFYYGLKDDRRRHRRIVRFSYPIWLYVTFTGVIVYLMISPYYNFPA